jgi:DNA-directed RNA polymerase III subunit RPC1
MGELSEVEVVNRELYESAGSVGEPTRHGVLDRRLGMSVKKTRCETCGLELADCAGHFGHVKLALPVFHIGYFKATLSILQCICKTCARILLEEDARQIYFKRLAAPGLDSVQRQSIIKGVCASCRKIPVCPHCGATNGIVRKIPPLKVVHDVWGKGGRPAAGAANVVPRGPVEAALQASGLGDGARALAGKAQDDLHPVRVLALFERIPAADVPLLGLDPAVGRPEWLLWQTVLVPPACIRPSVAQDGGSNEDDLTIKLTEIVYTNLILAEALDKGTPINALLADWDYLQLQVAMYIHAALPGVPPSMQQSSRPLRGFVQRLNGKQGRFRGNLSG